MWPKETINAGILIIGNEILSGQVQDVNLSFMAARLQEMGIRLKEARVVADVEDEIVTAVRTLSSQMDYVFTTGGIGPTHDDITAACMAKAFERPLVCSLEALRRLYERYPSPRAPEALTRMTVMPAGATLIDNTVSAAPGFQIENVYVMAGIPAIMQAMFTNLMPTLRKGPRLHSREVVGAVIEGVIAQDLEDLDKAYPHVEIGSYPYWISETNHGVRIVIKGITENEVTSVENAVMALMDQYRAL